MARADKKGRLRVTLRVRITVAFAAAMTIVLAALGAFVYLRLEKQLLYGIDRNLRSAAQGFSPTVDATRLGAPADGPLLVDPDEAFAQVLDPSGRILDSSRAVQDAPLLPAEVVRSITSPTFRTSTVAAIGEPARLLAVPTSLAGKPAVAIFGESLGDRADALRQFLVLYALAGPGRPARVLRWWLAARRSSAAPGRATPAASGGHLPHRRQRSAARAADR